MEYLKAMSIKKAYFCLTTFFLLIALIFSIVSIYGIGNILNHYGPSVKIKMEDGTDTSTAIVVHDDIYPFWYHILKFLQMFLPILSIIFSLLLSDFILYHVKLRKPLNALKDGAEHIMQNRLDFSVTYESNDELGKLCQVFEEMREELLKNNQEVWRQMEERKRLNAAFSHDLRNPITVLKGSAKILKKELMNLSFIPSNTNDSLLLIEEYTERIEAYIETMSSAQRLEELHCTYHYINSQTIAKELTDSIRLLTLDTGIQIIDHTNIENINLGIDKMVLFNVAENLIMNAVRYAKTKVQYYITLEQDMLNLSVQDDGLGFPQLILQKGAEPFLRGDTGNNDNSHFGMGLYVCRLLCEKHNGSLSLQNTSEGALVTAKFKIL